MRLEFLYTPTRDLKAALALYRDRLGWEEAWREGEGTVSLKLPGTDVQLMLDETDSEAADLARVAGHADAAHAAFNSPQPPGKSR